MARDDPRERILQAAMDTIAERGMAGLRMADVGERVGMSPGHILYYYRSKQRLLLETLRWSDDRLAAQRARELPTLATARERLARFVTIYLPTGTSHPEWLLWLQAWALGAENPEVAAATAELNARWAADLSSLVLFGSERGEFAAVDAGRFSEEFLAVLDGLSLHVLHDTPTLDPQRAAAFATSIAATQLGFDAKTVPATG
jgi:AcrR family transcriptional regulator